MRYKQWTPRRLRSAGSYWQARILGTAAHLEFFDWLGNRGRKRKSGNQPFWWNSGRMEDFSRCAVCNGITPKAGTEL